MQKYLLLSGIIRWLSCSINAKVDIVLHNATIYLIDSSFRTDGKFADFIILDRDMMKATDTEILGIKVLKTFVNGEKVYERN